jgi:subtilisin family serine protease
VVTARLRWTLALPAAALLGPLAAGAALPNDPGYHRQWGLQRMRVADAWSVSRGTGVTVAVVDTGVDLAHPDLKGKLLRGKDFIDGDSEPADQTGHGTHVAGTIAATVGNRIGVASVAPGAKILPVRVLDKDGEGDAGVVAEGIRWAADQGADVINLSLAQDDPGGLSLLGQNFFGDDRVDQAIRDAAARGAVVVIAAGNNDQGGRPETAYDATTAGVLVVGASTNSDRRAAYSNYGAGLDVLAPGGGSASDPEACPYDEKRADSAPDEGVVSTWWNPETKRSEYGVGCGTSMAVAHVSGLAALLVARGSSNAATVARILSTAHDLGPTGRDDQTGYGRVDAFRALDVRPPAVKTLPAAPKPSARPAAPQIGAAGSPSAVAPSPASSGAPPASEEPSSPPAAAAPPGARTPERPEAPIAVAAFLALALAAAHAARVAWTAARRR